jgi:hypothetical protein
MSQLQRPPHHETSGHPHRHRRRLHDRRADPLAEQYRARPRAQLRHQPGLVFSPPVRRRIRRYVPGHVTERPQPDRIRVQRHLMIGQRVPGRLIGQQPPPPQRPAHVHGLQH